MKKLILFACFLIFALLGYGQNSFKYPLIIGTNNGTGGYVRLNGATSGSSTIRVNPNAGTGTIFELPLNNGTNNYVLITNGSGVTSWYDPNNFGFRTAIQVGQQFIDSITNGIDISTVAVMKKADGPIEPIFTFGAGSGFIGDTALFNNGRIAGAFFNSSSDTLYITELRGILTTGAGTETISAQIRWHTGWLSSSATILNTTPMVIASKTTDAVVTTFNNNGIPPGCWIWCVLSGASSGNKPSMLVLQMTGYKRNRSR